MPVRELLVDPMLLCLPNPCNSARELESYTSALVNWSELVERDDVVVLISESALIALHEESEYPSFHRLKGVPTMEILRC